MARHDRLATTGSREIDAALEQVRARLATRRQAWIAEAVLVTVAALATAVATLAASLGGLVCTLVLGIGVLLIAAAAHWVGSVRPTRETAARWIERRIALEQRLITLVALDGRSRSPLWEELVADNLAHLPRWRPLGAGSGVEPIGAVLASATLVVAVLALLA